MKHQIKISAITSSSFENKVSQPSTILKNVKISRVLNMVSCLTLSLFIIHPQVMAKGNSVSSHEWNSFAGDLEGTSNAGPKNPHINLKNIKHRGLKVKWIYRTMKDENDFVYPYFGDVQYKPAVANVKIEGERKKLLFFPDYAGRFHGVDINGKVVNGLMENPVWRKDLAFDYSTEDERVLFSRGTPAVADTRIDGKKITLVVAGSSRSLGEHFLLPGIYCDTSPKPLCRPFDGAAIFAVNAATGKLEWLTRVDHHPASKINSTPVIIKHKGRQIILTTVSSWEEEFASSSPAKVLDVNASELAPYPCCSFRGSAVALDLKTGEILWKSYMAPLDAEPTDDVVSQDKINYKIAQGYSGNAAWGLGLTVDQKRNQLYATTGNNYTAPQAAKDCEIARRQAIADGDDKLAEKINEQCYQLNMDNGNYVDSIVALDISTGKTNWVFQTLTYDPWVHACSEPGFYRQRFEFSPVLQGFFNVFNFPFENVENCTTDPSSPDVGFARSPIIMNGIAVQSSGNHHKAKPYGHKKGHFPKGKGKKRDMLIGGSKDGYVYSINPDNGKLIWKTRTGPYGIVGGVQWAQATDGKRFYVVNTNSLNNNRAFDAPVYQHPLNIFYPGSPGVNLDKEPTEYSGPFEPIVLEPSAQTLVDGTVDNINTRLLSDGNIETTTSVIYALNPSNGEILWGRAINLNGAGKFDAEGNFDANAQVAGNIYSPITVSNGVLFYGSGGDIGNMAAVDASNGDYLWSITIPAPFGIAQQGVGDSCGSPAIVDNTLYWPLGCSYGGVFTPVTQGGNAANNNIGGLESRNNAVVALELCTKQDIENDVEGCHED